MLSALQSSHFHRSVFGYTNKFYQCKDVLFPSHFIYLLTHCLNGKSPTLKRRYIFIWSIIFWIAFVNRFAANERISGESIDISWKSAEKIGRRKWFVFDLKTVRTLSIQVYASQSESLQFQTPKEFLGPNLHFGCIIEGNLFWKSTCRIHY